jgi:thioredoxin reductase
MRDDYDVIVVGGGPAGLSGAVALGRALRSVLLIDAGEPRNAPAEGIHNFLTRDDVSPADFLAIGRAEAQKYGVEIVDGRVTAAELGFTVRLEDGRAFSARRLLVTTGLVDVLPEIPGLRERWGKTVLHCPYCHGWEERGRAIGVIGTVPMSADQALLWRQWTDDLTLFWPEAELGPLDDPRIASAGITVVTEPVAAIEDKGVRLADGRLVERDAVVAAARTAAKPIPGLNLPTAPYPFGETIVTTDPNTGATDVPGVWVAGNATNPMAQVISSAAAGLAAGAAINTDLIFGAYLPSPSSR